MLAGIVVALSMSNPLHFPPAGFRLAQALTGVVLGAYVQSSALSAVAGSWLAITLTGAATLALSLAAGATLSRLASVDKATAALGLVAGGASGIVGMARDLGADERLVAFMQYLRVLVVVIVTPLLVGIAFADGSTIGSAATTHVAAFGDLRGWGLTIAAILIGVALASLARLPVASLLGPMILTAGFALAAPSHVFAVPPVLRELAFAAIGLQVGLGFTVATLREVGRLLLPVLATVVVLLVACFGLAIALNATTSASLLDSYLATTPGGLYAVVATAYSAHADTTFIVATQTLRLFVMILLAPWVVRRLVHEPD